MSETTGAAAPIPAFPADPVCPWLTAPGTFYALRASLGLRGLSRITLAAYWNPFMDPDADTAPERVLLVGQNYVHELEPALWRLPRRGVPEWPSGLRDSDRTLRALYADSYMPGRPMDTRGVSSGTEARLRLNGRGYWRFLDPGVIPDDIRSTLSLCALQGLRTLRPRRSLYLAPSWRDEGIEHLTRLRMRQEQRRALAAAVRGAVRRGRDDGVDPVADDYYDFQRGFPEEHNLFTALTAYAGVFAVPAVRSINRALEPYTWDRITHYACGHWGTLDAGHSTVDGEVCEKCYEDHYVETVDGDIVHRDQAYYWDSDGEYHREPEPDDDDDDDDEDGDASPRHSFDARQCYDFNVMRVLCVDPSFTTTPSGDFHMGVELETVLKHKADIPVSEKVRAVRAELGGDYVLAKQDGSLDGGDIDGGGTGIEWVTRPTSLTTHIAKLSAWDTSRRGLVAWDAGCCGMHVHIDSRAFTKASLGKMIAFYNHAANVQFIRALAGRHPDTDSQANEYAGRDVSPGYASTPTRVLRNKPVSNRYVMVNLTNLSAVESERLGLNENQYGSSNTVEVRIFRASMLKTRMLAQLEFAHALVVYSRSAGFREMQHNHFTAWLARCPSAYPRLCKFLNIQPHKHGTQSRAPAVSHDTHDETRALEPAEPEPAEVQASEAPRTANVWFDEATTVANGRAGEGVTVEEMRVTLDAVIQELREASAQYNPPTVTWVAYDAERAEIATNYGCTATEWAEQSSRG